MEQPPGATVLFFNRKNDAVPLAISISLIISCISVSSAKYFEMDELFTYYAVTDTSITHMLFKADAFPALYYLCAWLWVKIFTPGEMSLRLFSCAGFVISVFVIWSALRRFFDLTSASLGVISIFCLMQQILYQNSQARFYGLFFAAVSAGIYMYSKEIGRAQNAFSFPFVQFIIHSVIVLSHLFGIFYSSAILLAYFASDTLAGNQPSLKRYYPIICGWLALIPWILFLLRQKAVILAQMGVNSPNILQLAKLYFVELLPGGMILDSVMRNVFVIIISHYPI